MTTTYDPFHPKYFDEADLRGELTRVYDLCHGCRLCFKFCTSFPTLFAFIDAHDDQDAARLTPEQQDQVVDECFGCKLCYVNCPYIPGQSDWNLDFPRLMMRAEQVRVASGQVPARGRLQNQALARTDLVGRLNVAAAPLANRAIGTPGSLTRKLMEKTVGIAAERVLPPYARQRFSTWFKKRLPGVRGQAPGPGRAVPDLPRRVPEPGHRPRPGAGLRAQRHRVLAAGRAGVLRRPLAALGRRRALRRGGSQEREGAGRRRAGRQRRRRAPAHVRLRAQEGLRRLHRRPRRPARGRPHLRRGRVPDEGAQGRRHRARHRVPR